MENSVKTIDTSKTILRKAGSVNYTYTAVEDCYVLVVMKAYNKLGTNVFINDVLARSLYTDSTVMVENSENFYLKKGNVLKINGNSSFMSNFVVYGVKS